MPKKKEELLNVALPELGGTTLGKILDILSVLDAQIDTQRASIPIPLVSYTKEQRRTVATQASLHRGEGTALGYVLDAAKTFPGTIESLNAADGGELDDKFEVDILTARLYVVEALENTSEKLRSFGDDIGDTGIFVGLKFKPVVLAAYRIYKTASVVNAAILSLISKTVDYYRDLVRPTATRVPTPPKA